MLNLLRSVRPFAGSQRALRGFSVPSGRLHSTNSRAPLLAIASAEPPPGSEKVLAVVGAIGFVMGASGYSAQCDEGDWSSPRWSEDGYLKKTIPPLIELYDRLAMRERDGIVRNDDAGRSPDDLFPLDGVPDAVSIARIGHRCTGWHIEKAVQGKQDADFVAYLKLLKLLVGNDPHNILRGIDPDKIERADLFLAFCYVFHKRSIPDTLVCCANRAGGGAGHHVETSAAAAFISTCTMFVGEEMMADTKVLVLPRAWTGASADAKPRVYAGLARCWPQLPILVAYDSRKSEGGGQVGTTGEFYDRLASLMIALSENGFAFLDSELDAYRLSMQLFNLELNVKGLTDQQSDCAVRSTVVELTEALRKHGKVDMPSMLGGVELPFTPASLGHFDESLTVPLASIAAKHSAQMRVDNPATITAELIKSFESIPDGKIVAVCRKLVDDRFSKTQPNRAPSGVLDTHADRMCFEGSSEVRQPLLVDASTLNESTILARADELRVGMRANEARQARLRPSELKGMRTTIGFEGAEESFLSTLKHLGHVRALVYYGHDVEALQRQPRPAPPSYEEPARQGRWTEKLLMDSNGVMRDPMQQFVTHRDASGRTVEGLVCNRDAKWRTLHVASCSLLQLLSADGKPPEVQVPSDASECLAGRGHVLKYESADWYFSELELQRHPGRNPRMGMFFHRVIGEWRPTSTMPVLSDDDIDALSGNPLTSACRGRGSPLLSGWGALQLRGWLRELYQTPKWQTMQAQPQPKSKRARHAPGQ